MERKYYKVVVYLFNSCYAKGFLCENYDRTRTGTHNDFYFSHRGQLFTFSQAIFWQAYLEVFFNYKTELKETFIHLN